MARSGSSTTSRSLPLSLLLSLLNLCHAALLRNQEGIRPQLSAESALPGQSLLEHSTRANSDLPLREKASSSSGPDSASIIRAGLSGHDCRLDFGKFLGQPLGMRNAFYLLLFLLTSHPLLGQRTHVVLCGGPALRTWEDLRVPPDRHDGYWANFVHSSNLRMDEIRKAYGSGDTIVWMVYKAGYETRGKEDGKPYLTWIREHATKRGARLVWLSSGDDFFREINKLPRGSVVNFDFFGHSNKHCFLLDYSNEIMGSSKAWIHENDLSRLRAAIFDKNAVCQSYGCHTGESMSAFWKRATGITLIGAKGKTDYVTLNQNKLPRVNGSWVR